MNRGSWYARTPAGVGGLGRRGVCGGTDGDAVGWGTVGGERDVRRRIGHRESGIEPGLAHGVVGGGGCDALVQQDAWRAGRCDIGAQRSQRLAGHHSSREQVQQVLLPRQVVLRRAGGSDMRLEPFVLGGLGAVSVNRTSSDSTFIRFAGDLGLGVGYRLGLRAEGRDLMYKFDRYGLNKA